MIDSQRFSQSFKLALDMHGDQTRKGSVIPFVGHLLGVTAIVIDDGGSEHEVLAVLLHDGRRMGGEETLDLIRDRVGEEVAENLNHHSDTFGNGKPTGKARDEVYLAHLEDLPTDDFGRKVLRDYLI
mgnify:CR=1 FL=1